MNRNQKLFRAIVVMGAAITAVPACVFLGDDDCGKCLPNPTDARVDSIADAQPMDAGVDTASTPSDAPVDSIVIII